MKYLSAIILLTFSFIASAADTTCTNASLRGGYAYNVNSGPLFSKAGRFYFDGHGSVKMSGRENRDGLYSYEKDTKGTYVVTPLCVALVEFTMEEFGNEENPQTFYVTLSNIAGQPAIAKSGLLTWTDTETQGGGEIISQ
jgi:hypothetical protein